MSSSLVTDPVYGGGEWERGAGGKELQFHATDQDIAEYFASLSQRFAGPLTVFESRGRILCEGTSLAALSGADVAAWQRDKEWQFWVTPSVRVPLLGDARDDHAKNHNSGEFHLNGLTLLQHGSRDRAGKLYRSRIAVISTIINRATGERVRHTHSVKLFNTLAGIIRPTLKFNTLHVNNEGTEWESDLDMMTPAAAERAAAGDYRVRAGRVAR